MGEHNCYGNNETDCIQKKAYEMWEKAGGPDGEALHYWLKAEKAVKNHNKSKGFSYTGK